MSPSWARACSANGASRIRSIVSCAGKHWRLPDSAIRQPGARDLYIQRALDRIAGMTMRLAASGQVERSAALLARLRVGVNIADLRIIGTMLDPAARDATVRVLEQFRRDRKSTRLNSSH